MTITCFNKNFFLSFFYPHHIQICFFFFLCNMHKGGTKKTHFRLLRITSVSLGGDRVQLIQRKPNHIRPVLAVVVGIPAAAEPNKCVQFTTIIFVFSFPLFRLLEKKNAQQQSSEPARVNFNHQHPVTVRITSRLLGPG